MTRILSRFKRQVVPLVFLLMFLGGFLLVAPGNDRPVKVDSSNILAGSASQESQVDETDLPNTTTQTLKNTASQSNLSRQSSTTDNTQPPTDVRTQNGQAVSNNSTAESVETYQAQLVINDAFMGNITVTQGDNHCDVLDQAQKTGVISALDMRYNSQYKTYAVHGINGQGDTNTVWWTYIVNGKSPPYGCSHALVKDGDTVNWKYIKN